MLLSLGGVAALNPPAAPSGLVASAEPNQIRLDWNDNPDPGLAGYHVYRSATSGGPYSRLDAPDTQLLEPVATTAITADKPQSKVWQHGARWWAVFPDSTGTWVWRLDNTSWTKVLKLSSSTTSRADCKANGDVTHILLYGGASSQLASIEFVPGDTPSYRPWSARNWIVDLSLSSGVETATIDIDSTGRMWLASDADTTIEVRYSDAPYSIWASPLVLATGVTTDDICAVTSLKNGQIAVLWSNQGSQRFGFRTHVDGASPTEWSIDEVPASQSTLAGMADDHLNVAVASDSTLYVAVKTSYDTADYPKIALLVRRPNGVWDPLYEVDQAGTRPLVVLNEQRGLLWVIYTATEGYNNIVFKSSLTGSIAFSSRQTLIPGAWNDVTSTKQNVTEEVVVLAASGSAIGGTLLHSGAPTITSSQFVDNNVVPGQTCYYVVSAENTLGLESPFSNEVMATGSGGALILYATALATSAGTVSGSTGATYADDSVVQTVTEATTGPKGRARFIADYTLGTVGDPQQVSDLVLQFKGSYSSLEQSDPLIVALWNNAAGAWERLNWSVGPARTLYQVNCGPVPANYINQAGQLRIRFTDTVELPQEKKDVLAVDFLAGLVTSGPNPPPLAPEGLQAAGGDTLVFLSWTQTTETDVVGYEVYRDGAMIGTAGLEAAFIDTGLNNGSTHNYIVTALDASGQRSDGSTSVAATPAATYPPLPPLNLAVTVGSANVTLAWTGNLETRVTSYSIYRSTSLPIVIGQETLLGTVPHTGAGASHTYNDPIVDLTQDTTFYYTITATDADSQASEPSTVLSALVKVVASEVLTIRTAEYAAKSKKLTVAASSTWDGSVTLTLYGGSNADTINFSAPLSNLAYDPATNLHSVALRTVAPPAYIAITSTGGGFTIVAPIAYK